MGGLKFYVDEFVQVYKHYVTSLDLVEPTLFVGLHSFTTSQSIHVNIKMHLPPPLQAWWRWAS